MDKVNEELKEKIKGKLESAKDELAEDISKSKIRRRLDDIAQVDGKLKAEFCLDGLPAKKEKGNGPMSDYDMSHKRWTKIFDSWKEFSKYGESFFTVEPEELIKMAKNEE